MEQGSAQTFLLPLGVVSTVDVGRLLREIDALNTFMRSAEVRQPGTSVKLPKTSKLLDEFLEINKKSALKDEDREEVAVFLKELRREAPTIHMSFSADPSPLFTQRLISWLRQNIHPDLLLQVGLQPTIGAGTVVRTTNKYFDLSLREFFNQKKAVLLAKMRSNDIGSEATPQEKESNATEEVTPQAQPETLSSAPVVPEETAQKPPEATSQSKTSEVEAPSNAAQPTVDDIASEELAADSEAKS